MNHPFWNRSPLMLAVLTFAALTACGGGDDDSSNSTTTSATPSNPPASSTTNVSGVLVVPATNATTSAVLMNDDAQRRRALGVSAASVACPQVPDGYNPLLNVPISFLNAGGVSQATLTTDACGNFSGSVPSTATTVSATPANLIAISQPISVFSSGTPALVSGVPSSASLVISVLQDLGAGKVAMTVTDSATGKAVLGLDASNFTFTVNSAAQTPSSVTSGASTAQAASVSIVLDASGSMESLVGTTGKTSIQVASIATHTLLDGLSTSGAEAGMIIFSSSIFSINDATLAGTRFSWADPAGIATAPYAFSANGLTKDLRKLRPIADMYNSKSAIYLSNKTGDTVHSDTGSVRLKSSYALSGSTAFYDATSAGLSLLANASNSRKIVVAMTDGEDNFSSKNSTTITAEAVTAGIPMYMVAFGTKTQVDETTMTKMAADSGGEYKRVEGTDLTGLFQSIQTGIRFQYLTTFPTALTKGAILATTVKAGALTATRTLTIR